MSTFSAEATTPGITETDPEIEVPELALVLAWSASEPHRVGEIAFFPAFERRIVGRGWQEIEGFALFARQRPGERHAPMGREGLLAGECVSRRQLLVHATAVALDIEQVGRCPTLVNGQERKVASLKPGDTVMLRKEALFVCVRRPRTLPAPRGQGDSHAFGEADAAGLVGESAGLWSVREALAWSAPASDHVLIRGETGTGKELVAAAIHRGSKRAEGPFVTHDSSTFTTARLQFELFGNVEHFPNYGIPARKGIFDSADHGTLFLHKLGVCPVAAQVSLLRSLDDGGWYAPVGESIERSADVRVIGATHRDYSLLDSGFRARFIDSITIPPLRERPEDVPLLLRHLMLQRAQRDPEIAERFVRTGASGRPEPRISGTLVDYLVRHPLPRNVRELETLLSKAIDASPGDEVKMAFAEGTPTPPSLTSEGATRTGGVRAGAARVLDHAG
jgi:transcriptional regulator with AAA-type ATPase domain